MGSRRDSTESVTDTPQSTSRFRLANPDLSLTSLNTMNTMKQISSKIGLAGNSSGHYIELNTQDEHHDHFLNEDDHVALHISTMSDKEHGEDGQMELGQISSAGTIDDDASLDNVHQPLGAYLMHPSSSENTHQGTSTISSAMLNLINAIVGAGVVGLPYALKQTGFISGIFLMIYLSYAVDWTLRLLATSTKLCGKNNYQDLVRHCFGRPGWFAISVFQFLFAFGGMTAYVVIVGDTIPVVVKQLLGTDPPEAVKILLSRRMITFVSTMLVMFPLSLFRDISKLAKTSAFAMFLLAYISISMILRGPFQDPATRSPPSFDFIRPSFLQGIGVMSFAFVCHHNSFLINESLKKPTLNRINKVIHYSIILSCVISLTIAISGYALFGDKTKGNIMNNYTKTDLMMNISRLFFAFNMFTTFPLECFVCREVIENLFFGNKLVSTKMHFTVTLLLCSASLAIALSTCELGVVLELTGSFSATVLAYILPPACFIKLASGSIWSWKKLLPLSCVVTGIGVMILSTVLTIIDAAKGKAEAKQCGW